MIHILFSRFIFFARWYLFNSLFH